MKYIVNQYELACNYDSRDSFYHKAKVNQYSDGSFRLQSYNTEILDYSNKGEMTRLVDKDILTNTTIRHCKEFLQQFNCKLSNGSITKQIMNLPVWEEKVESLQEKINEKREKVEQQELKTQSKKFLRNK